MSSSTRSSIASQVAGPVPAAVALIVAFILVLRGTSLLYPPDYSASGWLWALGATVLAAFAFASLQRSEGEHLLAARPAPFVPMRRMAIGFILMLAGLVLAIVTVVSLTLYDNHQTMRWLWIGGLSLLIFGAAVVGALGPAGEQIQTEGRKTDRRLLWLELGGIALLMLLAIFLRIYRLNQMPPGIFVDETNAALDALRIMEGRPDSPFGTGWFETPTLYAFYLVALFKFLGTTFIALKAASLIPAILTVAAMYPLARLLFGIPTAFAATFILAVSRWHLTMSRWGWNEVAPLLLMILALYFLLRAVRDKRASDYALGGLFLGLSHYTYLASRLALVTVLLYLLYRVLFERGFLHRQWRGLLIFFVLYFAVISPLLVTYARNPFTFANRSSQVSILNDMQAAYLAQQTPAPKIVGQVMRALGQPKEISLLPLQENVIRHLEMFHAAGDRNPRHNLPGAPMVDPVTGSLLILALGFALFQVFRPTASPDDPGDVVTGVSGGHRYALLLLWLLVPLLGGILTRLDEAPQAYRTLASVGAVALLAGDASVRSVRVFNSLLRREAGESRWVQWIPAGAMALLLIWGATLNYRLYFDVQAKDGRVWQAFSPIETTVASEVAARMDDASLYLSPRLYHFSPLTFLTYRSSETGGGGLDQPAYQLADPVTDLPISDPFAQDALFLLDTYYQDVPELFTADYPGTTFELVEGPGGNPLYLSVTVPGDEIAALQGLLGIYTQQTGTQGVVETYNGGSRFAWPPSLAAEAAEDATADWVGSLLIPASGLYDFAVDGPGEFTLDGQPWSGQQFLGKGLHAFAVQQSEPGADAVIVVSWLLPGKGENELIPPNYFFTVAPPAHGLTGQYFEGELWEGEPAFTRVDPMLLFAWPEAEPWPAPFSARWTGALSAPSSGTYRFQLNADDGVRMWLDGELVGESVRPDDVNMVDAEVALDAGPHDIRIDYFQRGGGKALELWWQPPGEQLQPVPPGVLSP